ncbi:MAG: hypothetical protein GYB68_05855 [Chloroflexi bacterium]|nr:hypothetical protein [Chloroflexota bacterium]
MSVTQGRAIDARRPLYDPWGAHEASYRSLTSGDAAALMAYLRSVDPVENFSPEPELAPGFETFPALEREPLGPLGIALNIAVFLLLGALIVWVVIRQGRTARRMRETDWVGTFSELANEARPEQQQEKPSDESTR